MARGLSVPEPARHWLAFMAMVGGVYLLAAVLNMLLVAAFMRLLRGLSFRTSVAAMWRPMVNSQLVHALATAGLAYAYLRIGSTVIVFAGALAVTFSRLLRDLMEAERLRDEAHERNEELAAANERLRRAHFGAMRSLVRSIHLHDRMTARHSAAVARYARGIARAAGCSDEDQQLVHTAGLLHDSASTSSTTRSSRATRSSTTSSGSSSSATPRRVPGSSGCSRARRPSPRSSTPTTSGSTAAATRAGCPARRSRVCRA